MDLNFRIDGYEIHMGRTHYLREIVAPFHIALKRERLPNETPLHQDGAASLDGRVWGTYIHGILHNDDFRRAWLNQIRYT